MIRLLVCFALLHAARCQSAIDLDNQFKDTVVANLTQEEQINSLKCLNIEGHASMCLSCYPCDDSRVRGKKTHPLTLSDKDCVKSEVCCLPSNELVARDNSVCGGINPEGLPRRRRPSIRAVLEREYPWRAWVYSTSDTNPLCAATYTGRQGLVTTASCVSGLNPATLEVRFTKTQSPPNKVKRIIVHEQFEKESHKNDIALLLLETSPTLVQPVCVSDVPPLYGTSCFSVSDNESHINTVIPQQSSCTGMEKFGEHLMCSLYPPQDYEPPLGAGVFCLENQNPVPRYILYGMSLDLRIGRVSSFHTNVTHYAKWIRQNTGSDEN